MTIADYDGWARERLLWRWFAGASRAAESIPYAPIALRGEQADPGDGCWMRADPVGMIADRDRVHWIPAAELAVTGAEAQGLCDRLRAALPESFASLHMATAERWYCQVAESAAPVDIAPAVPGGVVDPDALPRRLATLASECEMVLHEAPENRVREEQGKPLINGLWFWGAGRMPQLPALPSVVVTAADPFVRGLANLTGAGAALSVTGPGGNAMTRGLLVLEPPGWDEDLRRGLPDRLHDEAFEPWRRRQWLRLEVVEPTSQGLLVHRFGRWSWRRWWPPG